MKGDFLFNFVTHSLKSNFISLEVFISSSMILSKLYVLSPQYDALPISYSELG